MKLYLDQVQLPSVCVCVVATTMHSSLSFYVALVIVADNGGKVAQALMKHWCTCDFTHTVRRFAQHYTTSPYTLHSRAIRTLMAPYLWHLGALSN